MQIKKQIKRILIEKENRRYDRLLRKRKGTYGEWLAAREKEWRLQNEAVIADNAVAAVAKDAAVVETGNVTVAEKEVAESVLVCIGAGEIAPYAEESVGRYFAKYPEAQVLYGDEDVLTPGGEAALPWFKPDWSPDLLDSCFYFGSLVAVRKSHWSATRKKLEREIPGLWGKLFGTDEDRAVYRVKDLKACEKWLHCCVREGYRKDSRLVEHIPQILFHAESGRQQELFLEKSEFLQEAECRMFTEFRDRVAKRCGNGQPFLSVVIPSRDQPELLERCVEKVKLAGAGLSCEILVIDNGSSPKNRARIERLLQGAARYFYEPMEFNFSRMCNLGAEQARGELLLFLNDDVELGEACIREMAARALRGYTGAVGMKLLYPDTDLIQHDGVVSLLVGPVHKLQFHNDNKCYYYNRNKVNCNCTAVTGACLMVAADKFREAGGFPEELRVAYNDVALCFSLKRLGYHNVVVGDCAAWHHESLSRGDDESPEKQGRLMRERALLYQRYPEFYGTDPYYPQGLTMDGLDSRIVPAYVSCRNYAQKGNWKPFTRPLEEFRRDNCLMVRVDTSKTGNIQGYCVVLGDNNACYEKYLLLLPEQDGQKIFYTKTAGQYRQDLEENLPDQENVALGGFCVRQDGEKLPPGTYRIGMLAVNRVNGTKLWNESGRKWTVGTAEETAGV